MKGNDERPRFTMPDYLYFVMMGMANVPLILELWGIDTIFKPYRVCALVLALLAIPIVLNEGAITRRFTVPFLLAVGYMFAVTAIFGGASMLAQVPFIVTCFALFFATYVVTSRRALTMGLVCYLISFLVSSYFGLLAFNRGEYRFTGLFDNPNSFGFGGCFAVLILLNRYTPLSRNLSYFFGLVLTPIFILTGSRGTVLALVGCFASQLWRNPKMLWLTGAIVIASFVIGDLYSKEIGNFVGRRSVFTRYNQQIVSRGASGRIAQIKAGMQVAGEHGFIGIGLGQYRLKHHARFFRERDSRGRIRKLEIHNIYVSLLCEWGLFGFLCFAVLVYRLIEFTRHLDAERDFVFGFIGICALNGLGNNLLGEIPFWIMLGICIQLVRFAEDDQLIGWSPYPTSLPDAGLDQPEFDVR